MKTIQEAATEAFTDWASSGAAESEFLYMAEELALSAVEEWKPEKTPAADDASDRDTSTIDGAVLAAMDDWASSGHTVEEMESLVADHIQRAASDWESPAPRHISAPKM